MDNNDAKTLATFDNEIEANIVKGMLEANGIVAGVLGDNTASVLLRGFENGEWKVVVRTSDYDEAKALLDTPIIEDDEEDDEEQ